MSSSQQIIKVEGIDRESYASLLRLNPVGASPPTSAYITPDNQIALFSTSSSPLVTVTANARILLPDGTISLNQFSFNVPGGNVSASAQWSVPEGFLLTLCVYTNVGSSTRWAFVQANLVQTRQQPPLLTSVLCSGYPSSSVPISFPGGVNLNALDCIGNVRAITVTTPAAGNFVAQAVPNNVRWRLISVSFLFTTSAAIANRNVYLRFFRQGIYSFTQLANNGSQTAGQQWTYQLGSGITQFTSAAQLFAAAPIPTWDMLNQGDVVDVVCLGMDVADQFTNVVFEVEEWVCP